MIIDISAWIVAKTALWSFTRNNRFVDKSYIRHTAAFGPQDPFLSDMDVTFFVKAGDLTGLLAARKKIGEGISQSRVMKFFVNFLMVFPATKNAYELCKKYYPYRSLYPFETWRQPNDFTISRIRALGKALPLDQMPEKISYLYLHPVMVGGRKPHTREREFLSRKLKHEKMLLGVRGTQEKDVTLFSALFSTIKLWSSFYQSLEIPVQRTGLVFKWEREYDYREFFDKWISGPGILRNRQLVSSVWVYPDWLDESVPHVAVNLNLNITDKVFEEVAREVVKVFQGCKCSLVFGTEPSMLGRINALGMLNLFEPWLFQHYGVCLQGDYAIKDRIVSPSHEMLKQKFNEIMLYYVYSFMHQARYKYEFYKACFVCDHFFQTGEIVLSEEILAKIYGSVFIIRRNFKPEIHTVNFLVALEKLHHFSLWD